MKKIITKEEYTELLSVYEAVIVPRYKPDYKGCEFKGWYPFPDVEIYVEK